MKRSRSARLFAPTHAKGRRRRAPSAPLTAPVEVEAPRDGSRRRRGIALIMVLVITTVLSALAADLSNGTQVNLRAAVNARDELQAHFHARSALELELFVLRFQSMVKSSLGSFLPVPLFELSGMLVSSDTVKGIIDEDGEAEDEIFEPEEKSFASDLSIGDFQGSFWVEEIVDENRKINLNTDIGVGCSNMLHLMLGAVFEGPAFDPLFERMGESRDPVRNRIDVIAAITDWRDANETIDPVCILTQQEVGGAAEDANLDLLPYDAEYEPKNGMYDSLDELRMVPYVNDAFMRVFSRYFTVWGDTTGVSMRTADTGMLLAVVRAVMSRPVYPGDDERFQQFMDEWLLTTAIPGGKELVTKETFAAAMVAAGLPLDQTKLDELIKQEAIRFEDVSSVYKITTIGRVNDASSRLTVVWRDNRGSGEIKYWRED